MKFASLKEIKKHAKQNNLNLFCARAEFDGKPRNAAILRDGKWEHLDDGDRFSDYGRSTANYVSARRNGNVVTWYYYFLSPFEP